MTETATDDLAKALRWLTELLGELNTPYQIVGGLAARAHGATRPLVDIDLYVPDEALIPIAETAKGHLIEPPRHHLDDHWDLTFMKLRFGDMQIEIAGAESARVKDHRTGEWKPAGIQFAASEILAVAGVRLLVMPRKQLLEYKTGLDRDVDRQDLDEIS